MHYNTDLAYQKCRKIVVEHYENFPVGSMLVPAEKRKFVHAVYAFARYADDIADSHSLARDEKLRLLDLFEAELQKIKGSEPRNLNNETEYIFTALFDTIKNLEIPFGDFSDLISAFRQDAEGYRYKSNDELINYSKRSANPIGRTVLRIFGYSPSSSGRLFELSDNICTALQLTNFWQDVSVDLKMDRIYIPESIMNRHGYGIDELRNMVEDDRFRSAIEELCVFTEEFFQKGKELPDLVKGRLKYELKATILGGSAILTKIRELDFKVLSVRPSLSKADKFKILINAFLK